MVVKMGPFDSWMFSAEPYQVLQVKVKADQPSVEVPVLRYELRDEGQLRRVGYAKGLANTEAWREGQEVVFPLATITGSMLGVPTPHCSLTKVPETDEERLDWSALVASYTALTSSMAKYAKEIVNTAVDLRLKHPWFRAHVSALPSAMIAHFPYEKGFVIVKVSSDAYLEQQDTAFSLVHVPPAQKTTRSYIVQMSDALVNNQLFESLYFGTGLTHLSAFLATEASGQWSAGPAYEYYAS